MRTIIDREKWPEGEFKYLAPDGTSSDSPFDYVWTGVLGFCGCYSEELFNECFKLLWEMYDSRGVLYEADQKEFFLRRELFLHIFDSHGWVEHGVSIRYSWLTDKGKEVCRLLWPD